MKLRIHGGSIRLRLKQSEVKALVEGREVSEVCPTLPSPLIYSLRPDSSATALSVSAQGGHMAIAVPASWLPSWDTDQRVGFDGTDRGIELLIEKDFKCALPATPKDNEDCYENPVACG